MSKREYESLRLTKKPDPRRLNRNRGSKAGWMPGSNPTFEWDQFPHVADRIVQSFVEEGRVRDILSREGVTYKVFRSIMNHFLGEKYEKIVKDRKSKVGRENLKVAHEQWRSLTPSEKAKVLKTRFSHGSSLERVLRAQVEETGISLTTNEWTTLVVEGSLQPREADIKFSRGQQKIVVLCDGEAFHGPECVFGSSESRVREDVRTARAFYKAGYSVLRYSETEILEGEAIKHLQDALPRLWSERVYRTWHPACEEWEPLQRSRVIFLDDDVTEDDFTIKRRDG